MKKYKHFIWDWNGTILDDLNVSIDALNQLLIKEGKEIVTDVNLYRQIFQFPVIRYYEHVGFDFEKTPFPILAKLYMDHYRPHSLACSLHKGILDCLSTMKKKGYRMTLLSASDLSFLYVQLAQYPVLKDLFDEVLGLDHFHADSKESLAKSFVASLEHPEEVLFIGDSVHDHEVASASGCDCVLVSWGHEHPDKLRATNAPVIDDIKEIYKYL